MIHSPATRVGVFMHEIGHSAGGLLVIISISYVGILAGFGLRALKEGRSVRLLWPWMLMTIFGFCMLSGYATPLARMAGIALTPEFVIAEHAILAVVSWTYAVGQLLYLAWPSLFEDDTLLPKLAESTE